jgi:STE24 endopeptidase
MQPFTLVFISALAAHLIVQLWLARRQIMYVAAHRGSVPPGFQSAVSLDEHSKAADYVTARQRLGMVESIFDAIVLLALTIGGGIAAIGAFAASAVTRPIAVGTLQVLGVFATIALLSLPFSIYRTFVTEQRFGFNRTTVPVYVMDHLKAWALGALFGGALTAVVLSIMSSAGARWWIVAWATWMGFSLVVTWAWPRLIAPIFNKFSPLEDQGLRDRIESLVERCGFHAKSVFVMDGSRRSAHGNAYFTGLGREKRIVFFDTLLSSLTPPQVESVLAHELAHFRLRHVPQRLLAGAFMSFVGFALLGWLSRQNWFYTSLGVPEGSDAAALLLFVLVAPAFTWIAAPALAAWSRRHEYQADAFAAEHADAQSLAEALVKLYKDNASTLTPDPVYSAFHDSHPPPTARIERLLALRRNARQAPAAS